MEFLYQDRFSSGEYEKYLAGRAVDCLCKHVCMDTGEKTKALAKASEQIGYPQTWWGYEEGLHTDPTRNRLVQISRIQRFIAGGIIHSIRMVIDREGDLWPDNLHSTLAHILCRGPDTVLMQMPVYFVDMRGDIPGIVDGNRFIDFNRQKIKGLLQASEKRISRVSKAVKDVDYRIGEFMKDNEITLAAMTLPSVRFCVSFTILTDGMLNRKE